MPEPVLDSGQVCVIDAFHPITNTDPVPTAFCGSRSRTCKPQG